VTTDVLCGHCICATPVWGNVVVELRTPEPVEVSTRFLAPLQVQVGTGPRDTRRATLQANLGRCGYMAIAVLDHRRGTVGEG
jgi:hypothetical protein